MYGKRCSFLWQPNGGRSCTTSDKLLGRDDTPPPVATGAVARAGLVHGGTVYRGVGVIVEVSGSFHRLKARPAGRGRCPFLSPF